MVDEAAGAITQEIHHVLTPRHEGAVNTEGLTQGAHDDVYPVDVHIPVRRGALSLRPQHSKGMGLVENDPCAILLRQGGEFRERGDVTIHAEHPVRDDPGLPPAAAFQPLRQMGHIAMPVAMQARAGETHPVHQRGVVETVGVDPITAPDQRGDDPQIGQITATKEQRRLHSQPAGQGVRQHGMGGPLATEQGRGTSPYPTLLNLGDGGIT